MSFNNFSCLNCEFKICQYPQIKYVREGKTCQYPWAQKYPKGNNMSILTNLSTTSIICRSNTNWIGICENIDFYKTLWRVKTIYIFYVLVFQRKPCLRLMNRLTLWNTCNVLMHIILMKRRKKYSVYNFL